MSDEKDNSSAKTLKRHVPCPRCGQPALFHADNAFRPFCSERCKLIDLGAWASEDYRVPVDNSEFDQSIDTEIEDAQVDHDEEP